MAKLNELIDSINDENVSEIKEQIKTEADAMSKENKKLYSRAKKAEGFEYDKVRKEWIKVEKPESLKKSKESEQPEKSNEPDYAKLAWLNSNKVEHSDDQKIVMDEAKRLNLPLTDILQMAHIKSKLKDSNDQREAQAGAPKGGGKSGGANSQDVEYYLAKGTTPTDVELAEKVINARMKKEQAANKFSEELFTG